MLDKIINDVNNAYRIQSTFYDVYMSCGHPVADIETFLRSATLVIERVPDTSKSYDMQKGLPVCAMNTSFIDLMGWTLLFFCFLSTTQSNTKKCCFTHIEPDPPVRASSLVLSLSFSIAQLHRHGPNSQGNKSWQLAAKNSIFFFGSLHLAGFAWCASIKDNYLVGLSIFLIDFPIFLSGFGLPWQFRIMIVYVYPMHLAQTLQVRLQ
jgi:hypothetical protein